MDDSGPTTPASGSVSAVVASRPGAIRAGSEVALRALGLEQLWRLITTALVVLAGRLAGRPRKHAVEREMLSDFERTLVERSIVCGWLGGLVKAGEPPEKIMERVRALKRDKLLCSFTHSWLQGALESLKQLQK